MNNIFYIFVYFLWKRDVKKNIFCVNSPCDYMQKWYTVLSLSLSAASPFARCPGKYYQRIQVSSSPCPLGIVCCWGSSFAPNVTVTVMIAISNCNSNSNMFVIIVIVIISFQSIVIMIIVVCWCSNFAPVQLCVCARMGLWHRRVSVSPCNTWVCLQVYVGNFDASILLLLMSVYVCLYVFLQHQSHIQAHIHTQKKTKSHLVVRKVVSVRTKNQNHVLPCTSYLLEGFRDIGISIFIVVNVYLYLKMIVEVIFFWNFSKTI
jgi:hypothetical protein